MATHMNDVMVLQKCIITRSDSMVLAIKRTTSDRHRSGCWDLPGGGYEEGEDIVDAIKREVMEEVGLTITDPTPIYLASAIDDSSELMSGHIVFANFYYTRDWVGEIKLSNEHTQYKWVSPKDFLNLSFGSDGGFFVKAMKKYLSALPLSV